MRPIFFCHIPKTAGTTVRFAIQARFEPDDILPSEAMIRENGGSYPPVEKVVEILKVSAPKLVRGHYHFTLFGLLANPISIVVLRDPVERTISHFRHIVSKGFPEEKLRNALAQGKLPGGVPTDQMTRMLGGSPDLSDGAAYKRFMQKPHIAERLPSAIDNLKKATFVGFTDRMSELNAFLGTFGIAEPSRPLNVSRTELTFSPEEIETIRHNNSNDIELFNFARQERAACA